MRREEVEEGRDLQGQFGVGQKMTVSEATINVQVLFLSSFFPSISLHPYPSFAQSGCPPTSGKLRKISFPYDICRPEWDRGGVINHEPDSDTLSKAFYASSHHHPLLKHTHTTLPSHTTTTIKDQHWQGLWGLHCKQREPKEDKKRETISHTCKRTMAATVMFTGDIKRPGGYSLQLRDKVWWGTSGFAAL